jgi:hypothetical protein
MPIASSKSRPGAGCSTVSAIIADLWCTGSISTSRPRAPAASLSTGTRCTLLTVGFLPHSTMWRLLQQVEQVVAVAGAEVLQLRRFARARTDVADLAGARPELVEEQVGEVLQDPERTAGAVVEDRRGPDSRAPAAASRRSGRAPRPRTPAPARHPCGPAAAHAHRRILQLKEAAGAEAQEAAGHRMVRVAAQLVTTPFPGRRWRAFRRRPGAVPVAGRSAWSAKPGSGLTYDDGNKTFGFNWLNFVQASWSYANNEDADDTNSFDVPVARTQLRGHAFNRDITYRLQLDLAEDDERNGSILKDAYARYNFSRSDDSRVGLRFGQGKTLFGLEGTGWVHGLWFVDRSIASQAFAGARSRGAWIVGSLMEKDRPVRFALGATNGDVSQSLAAGQLDNPNTAPDESAPGFVGVGEENTNGSNELSYVASANWDILGDFFGGEQTAEYWRQGDMRGDDAPCRGTIGAGIALGNGVDAASTRDIESTSLNINTAWNCKSWNFLGEWFTRRDDIKTGVSDEEDVSGWAASLGYLLPKSGDSAMQWGLGLRVGMVETDAGEAGGVDFLTGVRGIGAAAGDVTEVSAVLNAFYNGDHSCKTQVQYTWQDIDETGTNGRTNHILSVLFQFTF